MRAPSGPRGGKTVTPGGLFRATVFMPQDLHRRIKRAAQAQERSISDLIVELLEPAYPPPPDSDTE